MSQKKTCSQICDAPKPAFDDFEFSRGYAMPLEEQNVIRGTRIAQRMTRGSILISLGKIGGAKHGKI